jgi:UDP-N-acetylmuramoyl-tripeptide--D-alanyl-D-alanine ligase
MRELGNVSEQEHRKLIERLQTMTLEKVWLVGTEFQAQQSAWTQENNTDKIRFYEDIQALKEDLHQACPEGMTWLIKGSNSIGLQKIVEDL